MSLTMLRVTSPFDQSTVAEVPYDTGPALETKVRAARAALERWRRVPLAERMRRLRDGVERFRGQKETIARDVTRQMGKPIAEARREVDTCCARAEYMLSIAERALAPDILPGKEPFQLRIEHVPHGVVLDIAAWNYPLLIPVNVVAPALIAGNAVLLKHSARTPLCGGHFERAFTPDDFPGLVTSLVLTHEDTAALIGNPAIDHVAFTGSVAGGREVYREAARRLIDAGLELGGKDPAYVAEDADLDFAAENVVDGACYNAGQSCCAVERVYVHRAVYQDFLRRAQDVLERYKLGDPLEEATTMGPLASRGAVEVCERQVDDALRRGARLLLGGKRLPDAKGHFFAPTLLADVPQDALAMQEETFGPLVPVAAVLDDDEAITRMNDSRYGLTASVWTRSAERAERFAREVEAGTIYQNRCDYLDPALAWTGWKESGKGCSLSSYGFLQVTKLKSIHFRTRTG
jgi:acyl-CoA reductase-like NAD-dependent aldehyde dehydrogenase